MSFIQKSRFVAKAVEFLVSLHFLYDLDLIVESVPVRDIMSLRTDQLQKFLADLLCVFTLSTVVLAEQISIRVINVHFKSIRNVNLQFGGRENDTGVITRNQSFHFLSLFTLDRLRAVLFCLKSAKHINDLIGHRLDDAFALLKADHQFLTFQCIICYFSKHTKSSCSFSSILL